MVLTRIGSRPVVGSSKKTISGSVTSARAMATRLRMPPEISAGFLSPISTRPTWTSFSSTRWAMSPSARLVFSRRGKATLSKTDIESKSAPPWNTTPNRRRRDPFGAGPAMEALVGADPGHERAEGQGLPEPDHDVGHVGEGVHLPEVRARRHAEQDDCDQVAAVDAGDVEDGSQHREGDD